MTISNDTQWLSTEQQGSWRAYLGGVTILQDKLDRDLRERHDLSMAEYEILVRLSETPEHRMRMAELASSVSHSRSRMTHTVARLERAAFVTRQACPADGRGVEAILTDAGFARLAEASHTHVRGVREYFVSQCTDEEFAMLGDVMQRIVEHLGGPRF